MDRDVTQDIDRRLRAARPAAARPDETAFDADLLASLHDRPIAARRTVPRRVAVPVAAGVTLTATAVVMLAGGPGEVGGPSSASAITQALHWLNPPAGTVLHVRSVESQGDRTSTRELWQSADHPGSARFRVETTGAPAFESAGGRLYDPATATIYDAAASPAKADVFKRPRSMPAGDDIVIKVRTLLQEGHMVVTGREVHNGVEAWAISLKPGLGRPVWRLWVAAADGKPLELRDPGRDASEAPQVIRWPTYEVLSGAHAHKLLSLTAAHPTARVEHDAARSAAAAQRLAPQGP
jgi:hypothetical protein